MAGKPLNLKKIYVVDTSYLVDLFKIGNYSDDAAQKIKNRFIHAEKAGDLIFVPLPCIYELGNHIADVRDGARRRELAYKVSCFIAKCITENKPCSITPATGTEQLPDLWDKFATDYIYYAKEKGESIGLVDAAVIYEAKRVKEEYKRRISKVHIWTRDETMKPHEPDKEPNPFIN